MLCLEPGHFSPDADTYSARSTVNRRRDGLSTTARPRHRKRQVVARGSTIRCLAGARPRSSGATRRRSEVGERGGSSVGPVMVRPGLKGGDAVALVKTVTPQTMTGEAGCFPRCDGSSQPSYPCQQEEAGLRPGRWCRAARARRTGVLRPVPAASTAPGNPRHELASHHGHARPPLSRADASTYGDAGDSSTASTGPPGVPSSCAPAW